MTYNNHNYDNGMENWQIAYLARELRHNKYIAFSCSKGAESLVIQQLGLFSYSAPIIKNKTYNPASNEVFMEITNAF